jgi:ABC-type nitrate/sulfonate/bicarbonate transport system substrate-binding protein
LNEYGAKLIFDVDKDLTADEADIIGDTLAYVTTTKFADSHKETLRKIFEAYVGVSKWVRGNLDEAFEISDRANKYPPSVRKAAREQFQGDEVLFPATEQDLKNLQLKADFLLRNKVLPRAIDVRKFVLNY